MNPTILNIPHVVTAITRSLSFSDLLSCLLINHAWHHAVVPEMYRDTITFRSPRKTRGFGESFQYRHYFRTAPEQQALFKYSHFIRALTCRGSEILAVLVHTDCTNLVEVNFLMDNRRYATHHDSSSSSVIDQDPALDTSPVGLANLTKLISRNLNLRAVSIEDFVVATEQDLQELRAFVDFLDNFPLISCFYLAGEGLGEVEMKVQLKAIWDQRLAAIDSSKIQSLSIKQPGGMSRSRRGLPSPTGCGESNKWPGRKGAQPISSVDSEWYFPRGRWEGDDVRRRPAQNALRPPACKVLAVLENSGVLEVCLPSLIFEESIGGLVKRFSRIRRLQTAALHYHEDILLLGALPGNLPQLREIDMQVYSLRKDLKLFLNDPQTTLSFVSLRDTCPIRFRTLSPLYFLPGGSLNYHNYLHKVIVNLNVGKTTLTMVQLFQVLEHCPNLVNFKVLGVVITEPDGRAECLPWVCKLRTLYLGLYIEGARCNMGKWESRDMSAVENVRRSTSAACRLAPLFMEQLGLQTDLEELELNFNEKHRPRASPFLQLDMDPKQGLDQLSKLRKLVSFGALGITHQVGQQEIEWMARHWPRLRILALSTMGVPGGEGLVPDRIGRLVQPQFWHWLPHLRTRVGFDWYTCPCCNEVPARAKTLSD